MTGKICLAKRKMEPSRFFRTFGAGPGAPCPLQCQLCLPVSVQKREEYPFLSQVRKLQLRRVHEQEKDWNTGSGSCCSLLVGPQAGPPSPTAEVCVRVCCRAGHPGHYDLSAFCQGSVCLSPNSPLYHFSWPASSIWAQGYLCLCLRWGQSMPSPAGPLSGSPTWVCIYFVATVTVSYTFSTQVSRNSQGPPTTSQLPLPGVTCMILFDYLSHGYLSPGQT